MQCYDIWKCYRSGRRHRSKKGNKSITIGTRSDSQSLHDDWDLHEAGQRILPEIITFMDSGHSTMVH